MCNLGLSMSGNILWITEVRFLTVREKSYKYGNVERQNKTLWGVADLECKVPVWIQDWGVGCGVCRQRWGRLNILTEEKKESQIPGEKGWGINFNLDSHSFHYPFKFWAESHKTHEVVYERAGSWYRLVTLAKLHKWPLGELCSDKSQTGCFRKSKTTTYSKGSIWSHGWPFPLWMVLENSAQSFGICSSLYTHTSHCMAPLSLIQCASGRLGSYSFLPTAPVSAS